MRLASWLGRNCVTTGIVASDRGPPLKRDWATGDNRTDVMPDDAHEIQINVPPELQAGVYANFALVSAQTPHDFNLDFVQLVPGNPGEPPEAHVVSRIKVAQSFLMPLMQALASHQTIFEEKLRELREQQEGGGDPE
jgi:hypothetical protein